MNDEYIEDMFGFNVFSPTTERTEVDKDNFAFYKRGKKRNR